MHTLPFILTYLRNMSLPPYPQAIVILLMMSNLFIILMRKWIELESVQGVIRRKIKKNKQTMEIFFLLKMSIELHLGRRARGWG